MLLVSPPPPPSHRKIPPAADSQLPAAPAPPSPAGPAAPTPPPHARTPPTPTGPRDGRVPAGINYTVGSPHAAAACSQPECGGGGSQSITSPLPANIPSPSFSKLPSTKASKSSRAKEAAGGTEPDSVARKRKQPLGAAASPPYKRTCPGDGPKSKSPACQVSAPPGKTKSPAVAALNGSACAGSRLKRALPPDCRPPLSAAPEPRGSPLRGVGVPPPPPRCISEDEVKKRKNSATYCRPSKPKHAAPPPAPPPAPSPAPPDLGCSVRRKKPGSALGFEEKRSVLKVRAVGGKGGHGALGGGYGCTPSCGCWRSPTRVRVEWENGGGDTGRSPTGRPERQLVQHEGGAGWGGGAPRGPSGLTRISPALGTPW